MCVYTSLRWVREERELRTIVYIRDCEESGGESACVLKLQGGERGERERKNNRGEGGKGVCVY